MVVLLLVAVYIRFLDGTACRGVITGNRQADHRAVRHRDRFLHQSFSECAAAYHYATVPVLYRTGKDFTGGSGCFVYQYDQTAFLKPSAG